MVLCPEGSDVAAGGCLKLADTAKALEWLRSQGAARLVVDSRQVQPGDAFVAWPGAAHDGRRFIAEALRAGARACLVDAQGVDAFADARNPRVAAVDGLKSRLGEIAAAFAGHPSRALQMVAFTGTNGKTSSTWWLAQASSLLGQRGAVVGTLGIGEPPTPGTGPNAWTATGLTTPDPVTLQQELARLSRAGVRLCAVEASSIGLVEQRLRATAITVAVLTNFTQDHLDYHGTLQAYWAAKRSLFDWPTLKAAVVNVDDPRGAALAEELASDSKLDARAPALWTVAQDRPARIEARSVRTTARGMAFDLVERAVPPVMAEGGIAAATVAMVLPVEVPFIGAYNVHNLLGVVAALRACGHGLQAIAAVLPRLTSVPGRLEPTGGAPGQPLAVIDYAHTPDALAKALQALRPLAQARGGRLWCVFGCGGDRDRSKRPLMGAIALQAADRVVLTSDNPRSEDPMRILQDIRAGMGGDVDVHGHEGVSQPARSQLADRASVHVEVDRATAVAWAVRRAAPSDVVLVAGKGHEDYQEVAGVRLPCRDLDLISAGLAARTESGVHNGPHSGTQGEPPSGSHIGTQQGGAGFMSLGAIAQALPGSRLLGPRELEIRRVHTDTRSLQPGDLYVALRGERFDGHDFLEAAAAAGAAAVLGEREPVRVADAGDRAAATAVPAIVVPDSLRALQDLAAAWRAQLKLPLIAVTGSNGKTTTTQMIASILRAWRGERAAATRGNLNNHIGVPLTVLGLRGGDAAQAHLAAVVELGMNHPGEIAELAAIAQPTVALVNNAQREHQEFMGTVEAVARENGAVLLGLPAGGAAVFPAEDAYAPLWTEMAGAARLWRFAWRTQADGALPSDLLAQQAHSPANQAAAGVQAEVWGRAVDVAGVWSLHLSTPVGEIQTTLAVPGTHNVHNAVAAATAALAAGAPPSAVTQGLAGFEPVQGRSRRVVTQRNGLALILIDDSYNANPDSVRAAIDLLAALPAPRALILGDMGEVGEQGPAFHEEVGAHAADRGLEHVWCVGALCAHAAQAAGLVAGAGAKTSARHFASVEHLIESLHELPPVGSILVKGSRFMRMERVVQALHPTAKGEH